MKKYIFCLLVNLVIFSIANAQENDKWNVAKSTHFIVHYKNSPREFIDKTIFKSEDYYDRIADDLGFRRFNFWLWDNRAKIYIYDNKEDYLAATGQPNWSSGCVFMEIKVIKTFPYAQGFLETILPHEMGHIIFREFVGFANRALPTWLDEGVASFQEKERYSRARGIIKESMEKGIFMGLQDLTNFNLHNASDKSLVQLFYAEAFSIVDFLMKEFGRDKFVNFCQNLRDKKDLRRAIASTYPFAKLEDLDVAWQKYLEK